MKERTIPGAALAISRNGQLILARGYSWITDIETHVEPGSLFRLASVYTQQKNWPEAIATWEAYTRATNGSAAGFNNLGFCYELAGNLTEAERAYRNGIEKDPDDPSCRVNYGLMLARNGRVDDAMAQLRVVLTPAEVHYNLGSVAEQQGRKEEAKAYYRKALELDPKLHDAKARLVALQ